MPKDHLACSEQLRAPTRTLQRRENKQSGKQGICVKDVKVGEAQTRGGRWVAREAVRRGAVSACAVGRHAARALTPACAAFVIVQIVPRVASFDGAGRR